MLESLESFALFGFEGGRFFVRGEGLVVVLFALLDMMELFGLCVLLFGLWVLLFGEGFLLFFGFYGDLG